MWFCVSHRTAFYCNLPQKKAVANLPVMQRTMKSAQEKGARQQKATGQIEFWENQKDNLKNMECNTIEEIAKKLEKLQSFEDEIAAAKMQYNQEQMWHMMDEAKGTGEKIAEQAEKLEPKTAEERKEEMAEEALGTDENKGVMTEIMEDITQITEELTEEMAEKAAEIDPQDELSEEHLKDAESLTDVVAENTPAQEQLLSQPHKYKRIDLLV